MAKPKQTYVKKVLTFYFTPLWRTFFTALYFLFFGYFVLYFSDYILLGLRFLYYTFNLPTIALTLDYLFWGASFIVMLVIPFSISLYAIFIPFELMKKLDWTRNQKIAVAFLVALATIDIVVASDIIVRIIEKQPPIVRFLQEIELVK
ncbi:MAG: hypothetical protein Q8R17_01900 [bacterium]|nr:hypothetical protein [bacterium]